MVDKLENWLLIIAHPFPLSCPYSSTGVSWDQLSYKLCALGY